MASEQDSNDAASSEPVPEAGSEDASEAESVASDEESQAQPDQPAESAKEAEPAEPAKEAEPAESAPEVVAEGAVESPQEVRPTEVEPTPVAKAFTFDDIKSELGEEVRDGLTLLSDVNLNVTIELGRTKMLVEDVIKLTEGAVVELDKLAGDPVDIFVNDRIVARGEVLVLNENFCVRVSEILASATLGDSTQGDSAQNAIGSAQGESAA